MSDVNISGSYVYRSLLNDRKLDIDFNNLEFGRGVMSFTQKDDVVKGTFDMGSGYKMTLEGTVYSVDKFSFLRMTGYGIPGTATDKWIYDYFGTIAPAWPDAVAQIPTIAGSVLRSVDHGSSKAGATATFYLVLTT